MNENAKQLMQTCKLKENRMETIKRHNPYNGMTWEEVIPTPEMNLPKNAVIVIINGKSEMVSKAYAYSLQTQGSIEIFDPNLML